MSELGQKEGQEQGEKAPFFDSAKITEKKEVEHFANVEGAEERAKKAEQARKAAEKEAKEVHAADVRAASEQMKKAEKAESGKKGGIAGFLFGGWHKWVTVGALVVCIFGAILCFVNINNETNKPSINVSSIYDDALKAAGYGTYNPDYYSGEKVIVDAINASTSDDDIRKLKIALARYYSEMYGDYEESLEMTETIEQEYGLDVGDDCFVLQSINIIYMTSGSSDKMAEYGEKLAKAKCIVRVDDGESQ